jgi:inhibitor of KinA
MSPLRHAAPAKEEARSSWRLIPMGDAAITVEFGDSIDPTVNALVISYAKRILEQNWSGIADVVPTFRSVTIHFDPLQWDMASLTDRLRVLLSSRPSVTESSGTLHEIPVLYGGDCGPDLDEVAACAGLEPSTVIRLHVSVQYRVYMIGFSPGFPYLGLVPPQLAIPRLSTPRPRVPAGSVGIADRQTGIYPIATPGGWRLIGRTPIRLYRQKGATPFLLKPGDRVRFRPIERDEFERLNREATDEEHRSQQ